MIKIHILYFAQKLLKILLVLLVLAVIALIGSNFLQCRVSEREYQPYLERLEAAYQLRRRNVIEEYDAKIRAASTEVEALAYQQEMSSILSRAAELYFSDKHSITRKREYGVLEVNWPEELKLLQEGDILDE